MFIFSDIYELRPYMISGVPRFWQALYQQWAEIVEEIKKTQPLLTQKECERQGYKEIRDKLGGRIMRYHFPFFLFKFFFNVTS